MPSGGHNKKSASTHATEGTLRKGRHKAEAASPPPAENLSAPPSLSKSLAREWDRFIGDLRDTGKPIVKSDLDTLSRGFAILDRCEKAGAAFDDAIAQGDTANVAKLSGSINSLAGRGYNIIETVKRAIMLREPASETDPMEILLKKARR